MSVKTQGTELFVVDNTEDPAVVLKLTCPTGLTGVTAGAATQIDTTCLDAKTDMNYVAGLNAPSTITVPFIFEPQDASHQYLFTLRETKERVRWAAGLSDGVAPPTVAAGEMVLPTTRTYLPFTAYVADLDLDVSTNEVVRGTLTLQRTGAVIPSFKAA